MNAAFLSLLLTVTPAGAIITKQGGFATLAACQAFALATPVRPHQQLACVDAAQLDAITRMVFQRPASAIWK